MATNVFDLMATLGLDSSKFDSGLDKAKSAGSALGTGIANAAKIGLKAITAATTAVAGFGAVSVKTGAEFDTSMSQVAATMGKTVDEIGDLRNFAQEMGRTTAFSATQAADALNYMALAGYDVDQSMEMLPNVLNLAAAGSMDLARASDMVTDASTAFGLSVDENGDRITQMVDEMAKAASTGNTSVEQLGDAFLTVGGLAQELNGGFVTLSDGTTQSVDGIQELEIALTAMANAGIKGSEAGTHMRNMLLKLSSPTSDGTKALQAMGVAVFDAQGDMRSLSDIFGDLSGKLGEMTQEQKIQTISDLFNTRDLASAEALLNAVGNDWDEIGEAILDADGAAKKMADTQLDNLAGSVTLFKSALEGAQIAISDVLSPALKEFVDFGTQGLSEITAAFQEGGLSSAMDKFGEILSEALTMIVSKLPEFVDAGMQLLGALGQGLMDNIDTIVYAAGDIIEMLLNKMLESTQANGGNTVLNILSEIAMIFAENYSQLLDVGAQILINIINGITESLPALIDYAVVILEQFIQTIIDNLPALIQAASEMILTLATGIGQALPELIPQALDAILVFVESLLDNIDLLIDAALQLIIGLAEGLINALPKLIEKAPIIIEKLVKGLVDNIPKILQAAAKIMIEFTKAVISNLPQILQAGAKILSSLVEGIVSMFKNLGSTMKEVGGMILEAFSGPVGKAFKWGADLIGNFLDGIGSMAGALWDGICDIGSGIVSFLGFSEPEKGPLSNFHTFAPDMMALFTQGIKDNTDMVTDQIAKSFDFSDVILDQDVNVKGTTDTGNGSPITMNIYGAQGQDVNELAEIISQKLDAMTGRRQIAMGAI